MLVFCLMRIGVVVAGDIGSTRIGVVVKHCGRTGMATGFV